MTRIFLIRQGEEEINRELSHIRFRRCAVLEIAYSKINS